MHDPERDETANGEAVDVNRALQYSLLAVFGVAVAAGYAHEAAEAAARFGWVGYPLVLGAGAVSFVFARYAWRTTTERLDPSAGPRDPESDASLDD